MTYLTQLGIFILVLAAMKFVFGLPISIVGSVILTLVLTLIFAAVNSATRSR